MNIKVSLVAAFFLLFSTAANADDSSFANRLFEKTVALQAEPFIDRLLIAVSREKYLPDAVVQIYRNSILELMHSSRYKKAYVDAYNKTFSESELKILVDLADHPGFALYLTKGSKITELTYPTFLDLLKLSKESVSQKLTAAGYGEYK